MRLPDGKSLAVMFMQHGAVMGEVSFFMGEVSFFLGE